MLRASGNAALLALFVLVVMQQTPVTNAHRSLLAGEPCCHGHPSDAAHALALKHVGTGDPSANRDRLACVYLLTDLNRKDRDRVAMLRKSIDLLRENLFPTTEANVYVFTTDVYVDDMRSALGEQGRLPNVAVLPLDNSSWSIPELGRDSTQWMGLFPAPYRLMGDWRMSFMPYFVRTMGHRFVLQLDDDSFILSPVGRDLVAMFEQNGLKIAAQKINRDPPQVTWGLAELARYFIVSHKIAPTQLFSYCRPRNLDGLHSTFDQKRLAGSLTPEQMQALQEDNMPSTGGWTRHVLYGNCVMYSLEWWFTPMVHRFVQLCRATGGPFMYRWNEQGVLAMLWQIFVRPEEFYMFEFDYRHRFLPGVFDKPGAGGGEEEEEEKEEGGGGGEEGGEGEEKEEGDEEEGR
ncbi:hypothetical protein HYH03_004882 [Edaphochlamys debaryana]|uniref:Uncharacterized protein n=1 Tax=Edaphochlamys debaryana TaxID=47281 RepID=A0A835YGR2_9CHLO|nr:hypothetical protein HYH03_004882 [Edaphochlamys debaryana]|eukprot:KAG2497299.1 hypothetical protein HYH03_004882 [Edaphochlamys debaryana]